MKLYYFTTIILLSVFANNSSAQEKYFSITIDDLPAAYYNGLSDSIKTDCFNRVLETLEKHDVKTYGFVTSKNIYKRSENLVKSFLTAGHTIGNHTDTHPDINVTSAKDYIKDIEVCQNIIKKFGQKEKYFRYTQLRRGNTKEKRDSVKQYLIENSYNVIPVTIDNDEWIYNKHYVDALKSGDKKKAERVGKDYVDYMLKIAEEFNELGKKLFRRNVKHILLVHMNPINAFYLDEVLSLLKKNNWNTVTVDNAMKDPIYSIKYDHLGNRGLSLLKKIK